MKPLQLAGSALLAKPRAFLALSGSARRHSSQGTAPENNIQMLLPTRLPEETRARNSLGD